MSKEQKCVRYIELFDENKSLGARIWVQKDTIPWIDENPPEFILWNNKLWKFIWRRADDLCGYQKVVSFVNAGY